MESLSLTIFCNPKPWIEPFDRIQRYAVNSWKSLPGNVSVVLLGSDKGTAEAAKELDVGHLPNVECNRWNTPLMSSIFKLIRGRCQPTDIACYVNADIVLGTDFSKSLMSVCEQAREAKRSEWLMVGKRTDFDPSDILQTDASVDDIRKRALEKGLDHGWGGIDYFVFPAHTFSFVYPFALGKFVYDQWLVGNAFRRGLWTVDCSKTVLAVHLNCPWYADGKSSMDREGIYQSEEATINRGFDYFQKDILSGTSYISEYDGSGAIRFRKKTLVPDW